MPSLVQVLHPVIWERTPNHATVLTWDLLQSLFFKRILKIVQNYCLPGEKSKEVFYSEETEHKIKLKAKDQNLNILVPAAIPQQSLLWRGVHPNPYSNKFLPPSCISISFSPWHIFALWCIPTPAMTNSTRLLTPLPLSAAVLSAAHRSLHHFRVLWHLSKQRASGPV